MAKKSSSNSSNKTKNTTRNKTNNSNTTKKRRSDLGNTTRIRIDTDRLNDFESLDTSFLEGRLDKLDKKKNKKREKLLLPKRDLNFSFEIVKSIIIIVLISIILIGLFVFFINHDFTSNSKTKVVVEEKSKKTIDDNYLFVGDFYTDKFNFEDYDYHYVKISGSEFTTLDIVNSMQENIYNFNPSIVFIQLGINDLNNDKEYNEIISNLSEIIDGIKNNRKYAKIYIESLYPINKDIESYDEDIISSNISNEKIRDINKMFKELANNKEVNYLDVYKELEKDNKLNEDYTDNGVYLNDKGYQKIKKIIKKVVDDEK